jgi:hypothetical protein
VFFNFVIEGLGGAADLDKDGQIGLEELSTFTKRRVLDFVRAEYDGARQMPVLKGEVGGLPVLVTLEAPKVAAWAGTLQAKGLALRLVVHVTTAASGAQSATFDSPDQNATGLRVDSVTLDRNSLHFETKGIGGRFEGKLNQAGTEAVGRWYQAGTSFPLALKKVDEQQAAPAPTARGQAWEGGLDLGNGSSLRLVLHVATGPGGVKSATLDSPDQMKRALRVDSLSSADGILTFEMKQLNARFEGVLNREGTEARGTWTQNGASIPLVLRRSETAAQVRRSGASNPR